MISAVEAWQYLRRVIWIAYGGVEIDHAVEFAAVADPRVNLLPYLFCLGRVKAIKEGVWKNCMLERWDSCADGSNSFLVRARYELAIAGYHVLSIDSFRGGNERARKENVIDAESENDVLHVRSAPRPLHLRLDLIPQGPVQVAVDRPPVGGY